MIRRLSIVAGIAVLFGSSSLARAEQYATAGGAKVAHTRVAPVVMHRMLPPFHGKHVYQGRTPSR